MKFSLRVLVGVLGVTTVPPEISGVGEDSPGDVIPTSVIGYPKSVLGSENAVV
jgi:hypothetical protein|tara:strand:- start:317 stop:475 length:159 start_codon:yes stop_codon:yes gene_type:complete